jgi:hypothetical protein
MDSRLFLLLGSSQLLEKFTFILAVHQLRQQHALMQIE